ncbi:MAG: PBSX family phage terminase large subunit [Casimicrobium sp.]
MAAKTVNLDIPDKLLPLLQPKRYKIIKGGRGSAKSWTVGRLLLAIAAGAPKRILCGRETQKSIAESVHHTLKSQINSLGLAHLYEVQETVIYGVSQGRRTGTEFHFAGLRQQGVVNIKSYEDFDILWIEEGQAMTKRTMEVVTPTFRKPGSEIWITFNPELDTDFVYDRYCVSPDDNVLVIDMSYLDNPWFTAELEQERLMTLQHDPDSYDNIWGGKCRPSVAGAIYAKELERVSSEGRIRTVPHDALLRVHRIWDIGYFDATAIILAQRAAGEIRVIGYHESKFKTYGEDLAEVRNAWPRVVWGRDFLPWDGNIPSKQTGKSAVEILNALGCTAMSVPQIGVDAGIQAARAMFPRVWFDRENALELVNRLKRYKRRINMVTGAPGEPVHDEASHGSDAFRYMAVAADMMDNDSPADEIRAAEVNEDWIV